MLEQMQNALSTPLEILIVLSRTQKRYKKAPSND